jgi:hypothetical protein
MLNLPLLLLTLLAVLGPKVASIPILLNALVENTSYSLAHPRSHAMLSLLSLSLELLSLAPQKQMLNSVLQILAQLVV